MTTKSVRIRASDGGDFEGSLAVPASGRGPGLILLAEIYNANPSPELYDRIRDSLAGEPHAHTYWYEDADHGFDRDGYEPYHPEAATLARRRTLDFLEQHLGGKSP